MPYFSTWRTPKDSAAAVTISCYLNPYGIRKISHLTICSSSDLSSSSVNNCSATSRKILAERSTRSGRNCNGSFSILGSETGKADAKAKAHESSKCTFTIMANKSSVRRRPFWRKLLFGSRKFRSIILLNVVTVVYGKLSQIYR